MCIRDRLYRAPGGKTSPALLRAAKACGFEHVGWAPAGFLGDELPSDKYPNAKLLEQALRTIKPVSYTHLDVYKRQALGLLNGSSRTAETLLDTTLQMIRNIPVLALIPLIILWFGIEETAKLALLSLGVFFPVYLNTFHGIRSVDPALIEMGLSLIHI